MKKILIYVLIFISFNVFAQQEVNLSNLIEDIGLGDGFSGIEIDCTAQTEYDFFTNEDVRLNGHYVAVYGSNLVVDADVYFGGSFLGYCDSTLIINGMLINTDPLDPGGNPFDVDGVPVTIEVIPDVFSLTGAIDMPNGVHLNYSTLYALAENQNKLNVEEIAPEFNYDRATRILDIKNTEIKIYNFLGQLLLEGNTTLDLSFIEDILVIVKTEFHSFKLAI